VQRAWRELAGRRAKTLRRFAGNGGKNVPRLTQRITLAFLEEWQGREVCAARGDLVACIAQ
jgi:hypothetical protein